MIKDDYSKEFSVKSNPLLATNTFNQFIGECLNIHVNYTELVSIRCYICRFVHNLICTRGNIKDKARGKLTTDEINTASNLLAKLV